VRHRDFNRCLSRGALQSMARWSGSQRIPADSASHQQYDNPFTGAGISPVEPKRTTGLEPATPGLGNPRAYAPGGTLGGTNGVVARGAVAAVPLALPHRRESGDYEVTTGSRPSALIACSDPNAAATTSARAPCRTPGCTRTPRPSTARRSTSCCASARDAHDGTPANARCPTLASESHVYGAFREGDFGRSCAYDERR
jgi:hypothetical protein